MTARLTALFVITAVLGFLVGARAVGSPSPAESAAATAGVREMHPLRGGFWRPAGSEAERPAVRLEPTAWAPSAPAALPASEARPDALAAVRAVIRLASLE
jgi:hypothetical protein